MTIKLYWEDPHLTRFNAKVVDAWNENGKQILVLDRTAFYPTGGGQPCDTGTIGPAAVLDVAIDDDDRILHTIDLAGSFAAGDPVECNIDWPRRLEMMQQHTGQHILSQAFFQLYGAETRGFRITDHTAEIDLTLDLHADEIEKAIIEAEDLADRIVFDDLEVRSRQYTTAEAAQLPLRKESFITDCVRVVEIDGYDWSPCGGTHVRRTGEVGLIAIRSWERAKKMARVQFVCGVRALRDYRAANHAADAVARTFSVGRDEIPSSVSRLLDENKRLTRRVRELAETATRIEANELAASAVETDGIKVVSKIFQERDLEELKLIAHRLAEHEGVAALLASREKDAVRLVFARSPDLTVDMNALMKVACERLDGRGGGKPDFAQGGGSKIEELEKAMEICKRKLIE